MLYVGIDPGEEWCGVATLEVLHEKRYVRAEARVYKISAHDGYIGMVHHLMDILPHSKLTTLIVEDYRVRASGHQRFGRGDTLRMIGALEYASQKIKAFSWHLIPPGPDKEVHQLFGGVIRRYRRKWPKRNSQHWNHCQSAWRVVGRFMLKYNVALLVRLRSPKAIRSMRRADQWIPAGPKSGDLIAPAVVWRL